ncbi:MAG: Fe-S-cluster containining protein [Myxococcota bacterium]|jgi:Fe-S-cluster containining protein
MTSLLHDLPSVYQGLLSSWFERPAPAESRSTCQSCAMCPSDPAPGSVTFEPSVKCCSFWPTLPNFLVGGMFRDERPELEEGRTRLRKRIDTRIGIVPHWLAAPIKYRVLSTAARHHAFGRSEALLCPYYERDQGNCTIWPYREGICSTFFCKYDSGADGREFWRALRDHLSDVEVVLTRHAVLTVGSDEMGGLAPGRDWMTREELEDREPADADYRSWWGSFVGQEESFYAATFDCISGLNSGDVVRLLGDSESLRVLEDAAVQIDSPSLPARLALNPDLRRADLGNGDVEVEGYSRYDARRYSTELLSGLELFRGGAEVETARRHASTLGVSLDDAVLVGLWQARVLVSVD